MFLPLYLLLSLLFLLIYDIILNFYKKRALFKFFLEHNGPRYYPYIGTNAFKDSNAFQTFIILKKRYGLPYSMWIKNQCYYVTDNPKEIKIILSHPQCFNKADFYNDSVKTLLFNGFAITELSEIDKWKLYRRFAAKSMRPVMLKLFTTTFNEFACYLSINFKEKNHYTNFDDLVGTVNQISFGSFMVNFLGIEQSRLKEYEDFPTCMQEGLSLSSKRTIVDMLMPQCYFKYFTPRGREFYKMIDRMRKEIYRVIQGKRKLLKENIGVGDSSNNLNFLDSYLQEEGNKFTDEEIFQQVYFLAAAGTETSATSISFFILKVGMHPDIQEKMYKEIIDTIGDTETISIDDLPKLKYTEQVLLEILRLYPILPVLGRQATDNIELDEKTLPKDCNVVITPYLVHRNEKYWPDPEKFDPDRFSPERSKNIEPGSYIPFLLGPRDCTGRYYAMTMMKIIVSNIIKNYRIVTKYQSIEDLGLYFFISLRTSSKVDIELISRQK
ncbi:cytochrome P450 4C1-like isoform X1 [Sitophilus oryzae]|uniref:Cytochrome P450 4C1-like isoform X1 n=1 Tax=Sitophilus oryzae TaxID=7048 RepID=A0A6J2XP02_SITOR|nr:cytochrome P450 4C1-like isoform X1 [Sitophilus oryzae]